MLASARSAFNDQVKSGEFSNWAGGDNAVGVEDSGIQRI
jgi:hypothetical protein